MVLHFVWFGWVVCGVWCGVVPFGLSFCFLSCVAGFCCLLWGCAVFVASGGYGLWILCRAYMVC